MSTNVFPTRGSHLTTGTMSSSERAHSPGRTVRSDASPASQSFGESLLKAWEDKARATLPSFMLPYFQTPDGSTAAQSLGNSAGPNDFVAESSSHAFHELGRETVPEADRSGGSGIDHTNGLLHPTLSPKSLARHRTAPGQSSPDHSNKSSSEPSSIDRRALTFSIAAVQVPLGDDASVNDGATSTGTAAVNGCRDSNDRGMSDARSASPASPCAAGARSPTTIVSLGAGEQAELPTLPPLAQGAGRVVAGGASTSHRRATAVAKHTEFSRQLALATRSAHERLADRMTEQLQQYCLEEAGMGLSSATWDAPLPGKRPFINLLAREFASRVETLGFEKLEWWNGRDWREAQGKFHVLHDTVYEKYYMKMRVAWLDRSSPEERVSVHEHIERGEHAPADATLLEQVQHTLNLQKHLLKEALDSQMRAVEAAASIRGSSNVATAEPQIEAVPTSGEVLIACDSPTAANEEPQVEAAPTSTEELANHSLPNAASGGPQVEASPTSGEDLDWRELCGA